MTAAQFAKIRVAGQIAGGAVIALSVILMFIQQQALYFIVAYSVFWVLNYLVIHHFIGTNVGEDFHGKPRSKTLLHPH